MKSVTFKCTNEEFATLRQVANSRNLTVSEHIRLSLLRSNLADELASQMLEKVDEAREQISAQIADFQNSSTDQKSKKEEIEPKAEIQNFQILEGLAGVLETLVLFASDQSQKQKINAIAAALLSQKPLPLLNRPK